MSQATKPELLAVHEAQHVKRMQKLDGLAPGAPPLRLSPSVTGSSWQHTAVLEYTRGVARQYTTAAGLTGASRALLPTLPPPAPSETRNRSSVETSHASCSSRELPHPATFCIYGHGQQGCSGSTLPRGAGDRDTRARGYDSIFLSEGSGEAALLAAGAVPRGGENTLMTPRPCDRPRPASN